MTIASDNFAGTGALSANWNNVVGHASRVVGKCTPSIAPAAYVWVGGTFSADQFSTVTLTGLPSSQVAATARYTAGQNGYVIVAGPTGTLNVYRSDAGVLTLLEGLSGYTFVLGDIVGVEIVGTKLRAFYNGVPQGSGSTDATYGAAAAPGFLLGALADTIEGFDAQDVIADLIGLPTLMQDTGFLPMFCTM